MQKDNNEILSTLVDGEHGKNKNILEDLAHNDIMRETWRRYHLIRDCLRGNLSEKIHNNFISELNLHLKNEPTIISNTKTKQFKLEPIIGFAIAASVAAVAVLGIQNKSNISPIERNDLDYKKLSDTILDIAKESGKEILKIYNKTDIDVTYKDDNSPLTLADKASNDIVED